MIDKGFNINLSDKIIEELGQKLVDKSREISTTDLEAISIHSPELLDNETFKKYFSLTPEAQQHKKKLDSELDSFLEDSFLEDSFLEDSF